MTFLAPLIITPEAQDALQELRQHAAKAPIDVRAVMEQIKTPKGRSAFQRKMGTHSLKIDGPWAFFVTFSIETGHRVGPCRHMSMSVDRKGRVPSPEAVLLVMGELGFSGGLAACEVWPEKLKDGATAINVVQPVAISAHHGTA